jgi:hypothetical protein
MQVFQPFARPANQDRRYFPLGTSTATPAKEYMTDFRTNAQKFEDSLAELLGSRERARAYVEKYHGEKK